MTRVQLYQNSPVPFDVAWQRERTAPMDSLVTIAISLFNYEQFIEECLSSLIHQTHTPLDLIIVDDSSRDSSIEVATRWLTNYSSRFCRSSILRHKHNSGLAQARNTAFSYSRVDPVFVLDVDNQIYPRAIERLLPYVIARTYDAAYTQLEFFGDEKSIGFADIWSKRFFRSGNYVDAMALVSRRSWRKAIFIPEMLCRYRIHKKSMLRTEANVAGERLPLQLTMRHSWLTL
jgi:glycosyltransferase involved in cell wall biosynthesis